MEFTIKNEFLKAVISSKGGEIRSICDAEGKEYLWQGDEATWTDRAPNLFPYIARLTNGSYTYKGETYHMDIHGFLMYSEMELVEQGDDFLVLELKCTEDTRSHYPFEFGFKMRWELKGETLETTYIVDNRDEKTMYFGVGGHPGFNVPMEEGLFFEDYHLDFGEGAYPVKEVFSDDCFVLEKDEEFKLRDNRYLDLSHSLFDNDAIVLREMPRSVTLESPRAKKAITVEFPQMDYLGLWHWPRTEVNYICIEPWSSLPSRKDVVEDLETQKSLLSLEAGGHYENKWTITIKNR